MYLNVFYWCVVISVNCRCAIQDLKKKEEMIAKREALLAEKSELEMKKLRTSQHLHRVYFVAE